MTVNQFVTMYLTRLLVLTLICAVPLRDDAGLFFDSVAFAATSVSGVASNGAVSPGEQEEAWDSEADDESDWPDDCPDNEQFPAENGEQPGILEIELDSEAEEMMCYGDYCVPFCSVDHCLLHDNDSWSFAWFTSFRTLKRLRI